MNEFPILTKYGLNDKILGNLNLMFLEDSANMISGKLDKYILGRITAQFSGVFRLITEKGEILAENSGKITFNAESQTQLPVIGDWVLCRVSKNCDHGVIETIVPRANRVVRKKAGKRFHPQVIAANIDLIVITSALDNEYNPARIERYLTLCSEACIDAILVFNKADLKIKKSETEFFDSVREQFPKNRCIFVSAMTGYGMDKFEEVMLPGMTITFLGSSGVGKSSLINHLANDEIARTSEIRESDSRGRHTTTHKEMFLLSNQAILIDNPGMREVGLWGEAEDLTTNFDDITVFVKSCRFSDCTHKCEPGCAVIEALENKKISSKRYDAFIKQQGEISSLNKKKALMESKHRRSSAAKCYIKNNSTNSNSTPKSKENSKKKNKKLSKVIKNMKKRDIK